MNPADSDANSLDENFWQGIFTELSKSESLTSEASEPASLPAGAPSASPGFVHLKTIPPDWNPTLAQGIEIARLDAGRKLATLQPDQFPELPEVEKNTLIAIRNSGRKLNLDMGENLVPRVYQGQEGFFSGCRGKLLLIGKTLHLLPSDRDGNIFVRIASDNMSATLHIEPGWGKGRIPDRSMAIEALRKSGVVYGIVEEELTSALRVGASNPAGEMGIVAAQGVRSVTGIPGCIEYFFALDSQGPPNLVLDSGGNVDFRNIQWVPSVVKDQLLARVTPTVPAQEGKNVLGETLRIPQPSSSYLIPGKNVRCEGEGREFYAEINGRVQLNGTRLDVMNVYVVNSDVDYHTGNVRFEGNVLITGTVRKGFEVEVDGDVVVLKNIEPCRIQAGRDVIVKGGALGSGKGEFRVTAGRNISVGYCEYAWMEAQGDITILNYALQSHLFSSGSIVAEGGQKDSVIGGEAVALKGITVKSLGSPAQIRTVAAAGINFVAKRELQRLLAQKKNCKLPWRRWMGSWRPQRKRLCKMPCLRRSWKP